MDEFKACSGLVFPRLLWGHRLSEISVSRFWVTVFRQALADQEGTRGIKGGSAVIHAGSALSAQALTSLSLYDTIGLQHRKKICGVDFFPLSPLTT